MLANWIKETSSTTGTGAITLAGAVTGYTTFGAHFTDGASVQYALSNGANREAGIGTYSAGVLTRTTVLETLVAGTYSASSPSAITLAGTTIITCAADANVMPTVHPVTHETRPGKIRVIEPTGTNDHTRINAATDGFVGRVILAPGNWQIAGTVYLRPYVWIEGCGRNATILTPSGSGVTMFGFDSTSQSFSANKQGCGIHDCTFYGYGSNAIAINTKMSTYSMQDVSVERVYFDGFSNGIGSSSDPVVKIGDPWGLRFFNNIIEQTGDRPAILVAANGGSVNGAMISHCKIKNNGGPNLQVSGCDSSMIMSNEFYTNKASAANLQIDAGKLNMLIGNTFEYGAGYGILLSSATVGNTLVGNTCIGDGSTSQYGIVLEAGSVSNTVIGCLALNYTSANLFDDNAAGSNRWVSVYNGSGWTDA